MLEENSDIGVAPGNKLEREEAGLHGFKLPKRDIWRVASTQPRQFIHQSLNKSSYIYSEQQYCQCKLKFEMSVLTLAIFVMLGFIGLNAQSLSTVVSSRLNDNTGLTILVHLQRIGDTYGKNGMWVGTKGQGRRLEGFIVRRLRPTDDFQIRYTAHLQSYGDVPERSEGEFIGTRGRSKRLEGFAIYLANQRGEIKYNVFYQAHLQNFGDTGIHKNGQFCGTKGQGRRVQAIRVWIEPQK